MDPVVGPLETFNERGNGRMTVPKRLVSDDVEPTLTDICSKFETMLPSLHTVIESLIQFVAAKELSVELETPNFSRIVESAEDPK